MNLVFVYHIKDNNVWKSNNFHLALPNQQLLSEKDTKCSLKSLAKEFPRHSFPRPEKRWAGESVKDLPGELQQEVRKEHLQKHEWQQ